MEGVPGVRAVTEQPRLRQVQARVQDMCGWKKNGFPGAQPVSLDRENIAFLSQRPYKVHLLSNTEKLSIILTILPSSHSDNPQDLMTTIYQGGHGEFC